mgnify:CR=1 FL=1
MPFAECVKLVICNGKPLSVAEYLFRIVLSGCNENLKALPSERFKLEEMPVHVLVDIAVIDHSVDL